MRVLSIFFFLLTPAALAAASSALRLTPWGDGFSAPVQVEPMPGEDGVFAVVEQAGRIVRFETRSKAKSTWLDVSSQVTYGGEAGLLGLAFHPRYRENGRFFLAYTSERPDYSQLLVERKRGDPRFEKVLLRIPKKFRNHNGSQVAFGPDGFLYLSTGDGGSAGDPDGNGQNTDALLGKMLRLDVDAAPAATGYGIPKDNPFATGGGRPEIFAWGLRNVWRFSFDRKTGDLWAGDVGQNREEEIDVVRRGGNYGWNVVEGALCFRPRNGCETGKFIAPLTTYGRSEGISVTGGFVYRGTKIPALEGTYVYGDFGSGTIWGLRPDATKTRAVSVTVLAKTSVSIAAFAQESDGELLVVGYDGSVYRLTAR